MTGLGAFCLPHEANAGSTVSEKRTVLKEWIGVEKTLHEARVAWTEEEAALRRHKTFLIKELELVEDEISKTKITSSDAQLEGESIEHDTMVQDAKTRAITVKADELEKRLREIVGRLPEVLIDKVMPLLDHAEGAGLGRRIQNYVGALNEIDKFNSQLSVVPEIIALDDARTQVTVLYLGLGRAYYLDRGNGRAGSGAPIGDKWEWTANNALAPSVSKLLQIYRNEVAAEFVVLPVEVK
ncbi:DUF3450 domain-containing protein [Verrucomicrobia bacterium]|nr:DUF3450 domain-containing protein [Verrucomicrobiota bacterium]